MTDRIDCTTCGGASLSGTGHKVWCSGHILSPDRPRRPEWVKRMQKNAKDLTGRAA